MCSTEVCDLLCRYERSPSIERNLDDVLTEVLQHLDLLLVELSLLFKRRSAAYVLHHGLQRVSDDAQENKRQSFHIADYPIWKRQ
jgi:hypothetical protein